MNILQKMGVVTGLVLVLLSGASVADAHQLATDKGASGILHIDPDDDPIIGHPAHLSLEVKDTAHAFRGELCDCMLTIRLNNEIVFQERVRTNDSGALDTTFTFPQRGLYKLAYQLHPLNGSEQFKSVNFEFDIRVIRERPGALGNPAVKETWSFLRSHYADTVIGGVGVVIAFSIIISDMIRRKINKHI